MVLGLLPAIRGGLGELAKTGQHTRLIHGYLKPYTRAFDEVRYFSYLEESLGQWTQDPEVLARVRLFPGARRHPWLYAFELPWRYRRQLRECAVLRVFQITGTIPALLAKRWFGTPYVTTYGFWYSSLARSRATRWLRGVVERLGLGGADAVIVTTPDLARYVADRVGVAKVRLIPNGVDTRRFSPAPAGPGAVREVLYVGRLSDEKNLGTLIDAAAKLLGRVSMRLALVGEGPCRRALATQAERLGVPVTFVPPVDHHELPAIFNRADAFVLPSLTEGHPKVLLEAMSCALPCIASDVAGNRAIVEPGRTGFLVDPRDPAALAGALERVFSEPELARALGQRARQRILERYDLERLVAEEIALLRQVAGRR